VGSIRGMQLCFILLMEGTDFSESICFTLLSDGKRKNVGICWNKNLKLYEHCIKAKLCKKWQNNMALAVRCW
jgi:hypothetical protein